MLVCAAIQTCLQQTHGCVAGPFSVFWPASRSGKRGRRVLGPSHLARRAYDGDVDDDPSEEGSDKGDGESSSDDDSTARYDSADEAAQDSGD